MSFPHERTRVLVVDADEAVRSEVRALLGRGRCMVDAAGTLIQARRLLNTHAYDALLLDPALPDGSGLDLLRARGDAGPAVLVLSARGRTPDVLRALEHGRTDFLAKPFAPEDLRGRVRALMQGEAPAGPARLELGGIVLDRQAQRATHRGGPIELAPHEYRILEALLLEPGETVARRDLLMRAWDPRNPTGPASLDAMVAELRRKVRLAGADIVAVRGIGYQIASRTPGFQEDEGFRTLFYDAAAGIALVDAAGRVVQFNPALRELLGHDTDRLRGAPFHELIEEAARDAAPSVPDLLQGEQGYHQAELPFQRADGTTLWGLVSLSPVRGAAGGAQRFALAMILDITERKRAEEALHRLSLTDELTGLYNRRGLLMLADQQWRLARRKGEQLVLVYVDLDGFKPINDTYGHEEGDRLLVATARILKDACRGSDTVARMGGDEFVVLATEAGAEGADALRERLRVRFERFNAQHRVGLPPLEASVGVVAFDAAETATLEELLGRADERMYAEKRRKSAARA